MLAQKCKDCKCLNNYLAVTCRGCGTTLYNSTNELTNKDGQEVEDKDVYRVDSINIVVKNYFKMSTTEIYEQERIIYG